MKVIFSGWDVKVSMFELRFAEKDRPECQAWLIHPDAINNQCGWIQQIQTSRATLYVPLLLFVGAEKKTAISKYKKEN